MSSALYQSFLEEKGHPPNHDQLLAFAKTKNTKLKYVDAKRTIAQHNATNSASSMSHSQSTPPQHIALSDLMIFQENRQQCSADSPIISNCLFLKRLVICLSYFDTLDITNNKTDQNKLELFCVDTHKSLLNDYIHLMTQHSGDLHEISQSYTKQYGVSGCTTSRHCEVAIRSRRHRRLQRTRTSAQPSHNFYVDICDSLHFYIIHLYHSGIRIKPKEIEHVLTNVSADQNHNDHGCFDIEFSKLQQLIKQKSSASNSILGDGSGNNKFNIHCVEEETFTSAMISQSLRDPTSHDLVHRFRVFLEQEEYDTDSMIHDIESLSNITNIMGDEESVGNMQQFILSNKLSNSSFSIGLVFYYWPYYKNYTDKKQLQMKTDWTNVNDHSGYSMKELYVEKKYASLKEELLASKYVSKLAFDKSIVHKATHYMRTENVKQTKAAGGDWMRFLHYGITAGTPLSIENVMCLITYCDFTALCTEFNSTFRQTTRFECLTAIKQRNMEYWWMSKILRETVQVFGDNKEGRDYGSTWRNVTGPFYCGMSFVMAIPEFNIRLCAPTSTSKCIEVATRFGGSQGMIIQVNNNGDAASATYLRCFQCAWLSRYPDEAECLFFGGNYRIRIESIILIKTCDNFQKYLKSLFYFDAMINGSDPLGSGYDKMSPNDLSKVVSRLRKLIDTECGSSKHQIEEYIINTFHLFCLKKRQIIINLCFMDLYFKALYPFIMNSVQRGDTHWQNDMSTTNLFKPTIFALFHNVKEIIIYTTASMVDDAHAYSFSLKSLFLLISEVSIKLKIKIYAKQKNTVQRSWLFDAYVGDFTYALKSLLAEKGWNAQRETVTNVKGEREDCVVMHNDNVRSHANRLPTQPSCLSLLSSTSASVTSLLSSGSKSNLLTQKFVGGFNLVQRRQYAGDYRGSYQFAQYPKAPHSNRNKQSKLISSDIAQGSGQMYDANMKTKATRWQPPPGFGMTNTNANRANPVWQMNRGNINLGAVNNATNTQSAFHYDPRKIEILKWKKTKDPSTGREYWYHKDTNQTRWEPPPAIQKFKAEAEVSGISGMADIEEPVWDAAEGSDYSSSGSYYDDGESEEDEESEESTQPQNRQGFPNVAARGQSAQSHPFNGFNPQQQPQRRWNQGPKQQGGYPQQFQDNSTKFGGGPPTQFQAANIQQQQPQTEHRDEKQAEDNPWISAEEAKSRVIVRDTLKRYWQIGAEQSFKLDGWA
eukprot:747807_1